MKKPKVNLTIVDEFDPETLCMLQAFYSRSHLPIMERLSTLGTDKDDIKNKLKKWYVGYGHKSIGQCGHTTIFIEGVSILAAKVFQDTALYNGQETSTRYIDFTKQAIHDPLDRPSILNKWLDFYAEAYDQTLEHVITKYEIDRDDETQINAAKARTFDILRSFIPAGASTQLSWHTSITHASDRLEQLCFHPLKEVRDVSNAIVQYLMSKYPSACDKLNERVLKHKDYYEYNNLGLNYLIADDVELERWPSFKHSSFVPTHLRTLDGIERVRGVPVPRHLQYQGRLQFKYKLDYGSFRDIQRHRPCVQMLPILTTRYGFHNWYLDSLPPSLQRRAFLLIQSQTSEINKMYTENASTYIQYYIPLGYIVPCLLDCDYPQAVYISELRTSKTVHPTLRHIAQKMAHVTEQIGFCTMFDDKDKNDFTVNRGKQTIKEIK